MTTGERLQNPPDHGNHAARAPREDIHEFIAALPDASTSAATIALLLRSDGSTPAKAGARAVIDSTGSLLAGTIGGGALEAEAQRRAVDVLRLRRLEVFEFDLHGDGPPLSDPICGGRLRVLVMPASDALRRVHRQAAKALQRSQRGVLVTEILHGVPPVLTARWVEEPSAAARGEFPGAAVLLAAMQSETPQFLAQQESLLGIRREALVEPLLPNPRLLIVGGGHVGQAVALQASLVGFEVTVLEDRPQFARKELFPEGTTTLCGAIAAELERFAFTTDTYVVIVTRGHTHDATALAVCLRKPAAYLGMIGSRRKVALVRKEFIDSRRATPEAMARVYAPIGLDLGAVTVPEIATSIVAQLIAVRRKGSAARMPSA